MSAHPRDREQAQHLLLHAFGQDIQTPTGTIRGIIRETTDDARLGRKGQPGLTLCLSQKVMYVSAADAQGLSPGDALGIDGQPLVIDPSAAQLTDLGLLRYRLLPDTASPDGDPWR